MEKSQSANRRGKLAKSIGRKGSQSSKRRGRILYFA